MTQTEAIERLRTIVEEGTPPPACDVLSWNMDALETVSAAVATIANLTTELESNKRKIAYLLLSKKQVEDRLGNVKRELECLRVRVQELEQELSPLRLDA